MRLRHAAYSTIAMGHFWLACRENLDRSQARLVDGISISPHDL